MVFLLLLGLIAGTMVPIQTSINSRLIEYTKSSFYASTISFAVGSLFLIIVNLIVNPSVFNANYYHFDFNYTWITGGILGVIFLTGNLILFPRLGASLTVIITIAGQIVMGVLIDTFGWFGAEAQPFTFLKLCGILLLFFGIFIMNYSKQSGATETQNNPLALILWLAIGFAFGFAPPIQTAINSQLGQTVQSPFLASFISFFVGTVALFIITLIMNRSLKMRAHSPELGKIKWFYFIGGILGVVFVTANIILMPHLGAALTTIIAMLGQMLMGILIDHFALLGAPRNRISVRKCVGVICIIIGIVILRLF